jgi:Uma2 family endonuclease
MRQVAATAERGGTMTLQEWAALDEEVEGELVDGVLKEEEMPSVLHEAIVFCLAALLQPWVRRRRGLGAGSEIRLAVGPRRGRKPDLSIFLPPNLPRPTDTLVRVPPHIAVEVVSQRRRDARRDRVDKLGDYAAIGVRHYWIVDPQLRSLEVYILGPDGRYAPALTATRSRVRIPGCPGLSLDLTALWDDAERTERAFRRRRRRR